MKTIKLNLETVDLYKNCFDKNGSLKDKYRIIWQLIENSTKKSYVDIAFDEKNKRTAGIYAASCVNFLINKNIVIACQSLDTIVDENYRGQGLFIKLAKSVYHNLEKDNVAFIYGFPNKNSIHGFVKYLNWTELAPVPFIIRPLRTEYFTNKLKLLKFLPNINLPLIAIKSRDYHFVERNLFPNEINQLWKSFSKNISVSINRDQNYLNWRYLEKPNENYRIIHCYDKSGNYEGLVIFTVKNKHGGRIGYIMELIYNPKKQYCGSLLLNKALKEIKKEKADVVLAWNFKHSPNQKAFKKNLFFKLPEKLRPIELHFGVRVFSDKNNEIIKNYKNWFLSYSDSDTV